MIFVPLKKLARICRNLTGMIKALCWTNPVVNHHLPRCLKAGKAVSGLKCGLPNRCVISIPEDGYPRLPERVVRNTDLFLFFVWKSSITPMLVMFLISLPPISPEHRLVGKVGVST